MFWHWLYWQSEVSFENDMNKCFKMILRTLTGINRNRAKDDKWTKHKLKAPCLDIKKRWKTSVKKLSGSLESDFKKLNEILKVDKETEEEILEEANKVVEELQAAIDETNARLNALMKEIEEEYAKIEDANESGESDES